MQAQLSKLQSCLQSNNFEEGMAIVQQCKIARLTQPAGSIISDADYTTVLESAILLSAAQGDLDCLGRHMQQYLAHNSASSSSLSPHMQGLHLMALLVQQLDAEFHAQLERWTTDTTTTKNDPFLQFPITLERKLMVGMYDQILQVQVPHPSFQVFLDLLQTNTVREAICDNLEASYETLSLKDAAALIGIEGTDVTAAAATYVEEERDDWIVQGDMITFQPLANDQDAIIPAAEKWIQQTLNYAGEMEQIV